MPWDSDSAPDPELSLRRIRILTIGVMVAAGALVARLWWVQIACGSSYEQMCAGTRLRHIPIRAPRGLIYDRAGRPMATTTMEYIVVVDPVDLRRHSAQERAEIFSRAATILNMSVTEIQDILDRSSKAGLNTIKLKSGVGPAVVTRILENADDLPGFDVARVPSRSYPMGAVGAHVLGYLGDVTPEDLKRLGRAYNGADQVGKQGLERYYEPELRGVDGDAAIEVNARGVPVSSADIPKSRPTPGDTLVLSLDSRIQRVAQDAFPQNMKGSVVVVNVNDGGVLALVSRPGFDPNVFVDGSPDARKRRAAYLLDPAGPMQDRAVMSRYPPGSTFKLVTSAAGFIYGKINPAETVWCAGGMRIGTHGGWKKCWAFHGSVNYLKAMAQSCDTYFYTVMERLSSSELAKTARQFGLGQRSGIDLDGEAKGLIPTPEWKRQHFRGERWWMGDSCNMAIGQGYVQTTPLQMALVTAAIANGGKWLRPHLVQLIKAPGGKVLKQIGAKVNGAIPISSADLKLIQQGMRSAVLPGGTAGIVRFPDLAVAAKTGSAQDLPDPRTHAWFVCYAPFDHPQIAICVMVEHGGHGGGTAGPVARAILKSYFNLSAGAGTISNRTD